MISGTIILLDRAGERVRSAQYKQRSQRWEVIKKWAEMYGERFKKCCLLVCPVVNELMVNADGTNMRKPKKGYKTTGADVAYKKRKIKLKQFDESGNRMSSHLYIN